MIPLNIKLMYFKNKFKTITRKRMVYLKAILWTKIKKRKQNTWYTSMEGLQYRLIN